MIKGFATENGVNLESTLEISEGVKNAIINNPDKMKALLSDLKVSHTIATSEEGMTVSKMGIRLGYKFDPVRECTTLSDKHNTLLIEANKWLKEPESFDNVQQENNERPTTEEDDEPTMFFIGIPVMIM